MVDGINHTVCNHIVGKSICGAFATHRIEIPVEGVPPLPVCYKHMKEYSPEMVKAVSELAIKLFFAEEKRNAAGE